MDRARTYIKEMKNLSCGATPGLPLRAAKWSLVIGSPVSLLNPKTAARSGET
jgi:hypothetical protein